MNDCNVVRATKNYGTNVKFIDKANVSKNNKIIDLCRQKEIASKEHKFILHVNSFANGSNVEDGVLS